ncbi:hypothetical protein V5799_029250 [Amblyomma americanum]|uniref:Urocanase N-terminal domain-containing protein n=1 Tax=Amblyomma americanum TaxID=6943 RepID=A0AAQ4ERR6_AMBAM
MRAAATVTKSQRNTAKSVSAPVSATFRDVIDVGASGAIISVFSFMTSSSSGITKGKWSARLPPQASAGIQSRAYPIDDYPAKSKQAAAVMLMIMNNLDPQVAQFPEELVTYGGNGQVFSNWAQFRLVMKYLSQMSETQTLVMYSGHPLGLFPGLQPSPRVVITNGMVIPNHSSPEDYDRMFAMGVSM